MAEMAYVTAPPENGRDPQPLSGRGSVRPAVDRSP